MNLSAAIKQKASALTSVQNKKKSRENIEFNKRVEALAPIIGKIKPALADYGLSVTLHTDKSHYPCPAIHIKGRAVSFNSPIYNRISEICGSKEDGFAAGSCNRHIYKFDTEDKLIGHITDAVATSIASGYLVRQ